MLISHTDNYLHCQVGKEAIIITYMSVIIVLSAAITAYSIIILNTYNYMHNHLLGSQVEDIYKIALPPCISLAFFERTDI